MGVQLTSRQIARLSKSIGQEIRGARLAKKLTQAQLGAKLGVSESRISHLELGLKEPFMSTLIRVAKALDLDATTFVYPALLQFTPKSR